MRTKSLLALVGFFLLVMAGAQAQCIPDTNVTHNVNGVYPDSATGLPHAMVGDPYATTIQLKVVRDTMYAVGPLMFPAVVDSLVITGVTGLPAGFSYTCTPPNCSFPGGSDGCILLQGPAPTVSAVGVYPITVDIMAYGTVTGLGPATVPSSIGYYAITIDNSTGISVVAPNRLTVSEFTPNPVAQSAYIKIGLPEAGRVRMETTDLLGNRIQDVSVMADRGWNTLSVNADDFRPGIYLTKIYFGKDAIIRRMIVTSR